MIDNGSKVMVLLDSSYGGRFSGMHGAVQKVYRSGVRCRYGVKLDGTRNPESKEGLFWFTEDQLALLREDNQLVDAKPDPLFHKRNMAANRGLMVKKVIFNGPKTIVIWMDGSKTIATCHYGDEFDPYAGFCAAVTKRVFGSTNAAKKVLEPFMPELPVLNLTDHVSGTMNGLAEAISKIQKKLTGGNDNA